MNHALEMHKYVATDRFLCEIQSLKQAKKDRTIEPACSVYGSFIKPHNMSYIYMSHLLLSPTSLHTIIAVSEHFIYLLCIKAK